MPYGIGNGPNYAQFVKPLDSQTSAQFIWNICLEGGPHSGERPSCRR